MMDGGLICAVSLFNAPLSHAESGIGFISVCIDERSRMSVIVDVKITY